MISGKIMNHMEYEVFFSSNHAGFRFGLSTLTQLTSTQAHIIDIVLTNSIMSTEFTHI